MTDADFAALLAAVTSLGRHVFVRLPGGGVLTLTREQAGRLAEVLGEKARGAAGSRDGSPRPLRDAVEDWR